MPSSHSPDRLVVGFDDDHAVANAGLLLPATLAERLGIEQIVDRLIELGDRPGAHRPRSGEHSASQRGQVVTSTAKTSGSVWVRLLTGRSRSRSVSIRPRARAA